MRIRYKVALVGIIPITVAAAIALIAWLLLDQAERARGGAALAGAAFRDLVEVVNAKESYIRGQPAERERQAVRFDGAAGRARTLLEELDGYFGTETQRSTAGDVSQTLESYAREMGQLRALTEESDRKVAELNARTASLVILTDRARTRQHVSNTDIIASITAGDRRLRQARDIVSVAHDLRAAALEGRLVAAGEPKGAGDTSLLAEARIRNAAERLAEALRAAGNTRAADQLRETVTGAAGRDGAREFDDWLDRLIKVNATEERALHDEVTQLLTYAVQAAETEQATQNIAIEMLELERLTTNALAIRDADAVARMVGESRLLERTMSVLPISPLIQTEMMDAMTQWQERLSATGESLREQNEILSRMAATASVMTARASSLYEMLASNADRIGHLVRTTLVIGAAIGLLLGSLTAYVVARSITRPLRNLQHRMIGLAANPAGSLIPEADRRDELGAMARAANVFVTELSRRERDLRSAKERADAALAELRDAQQSLIQAEKLASLGQLVAGVAHEINTPVGVAMTTSTALESEVEALRQKLETGRLMKSDMTRTVERLSEGARLTFVNLNRAADLVYSFKQIAADQASGERRRFELKGWLHELLTSLGPMLRRAGHEMRVECPDDITLDSYPGALVQVITNLISNARDHAFPDGRTGHLALLVTRLRGGWVRIEFSDDGVGIAPEHMPKVFDPFYTTGRDRGSTGLGLHIIYNLVTGTLGGRIDMTSRCGVGTRVRIEIPADLGSVGAEGAKPDGVAEHTT
ncbi:sensor histidine kinase [Enterovirga aerilata]|uniref:histidine kinase n=1 Tax=Enterovirga aerilata TaxID=2730920 RepID=A0A849IGI7_9HYPH|nr:HAMP domain-containing sensor histidine kinase [Enterovirga sp. DB1703]NNM73033.1 HAMP domain-containing histidine kinase [Enterovirga sp. DB1703]